MLLGEIVPSGVPVYQHGERPNGGVVLVGLRSASA